jgi:predicted nucleotidyltransferase
MAGEFSICCAKNLLICLVFLDPCPSTLPPVDYNLSARQPEDRSQARQGRGMSNNPGRPALPLRARHLAIVQDMLRCYLPQAEVWTYGSRVNGDHCEVSDLDLVVRQPDDLTRRQPDLDGAAAPSRRAICRTRSRSSMGRVFRPRFAKRSKPAMWFCSLRIAPLLGPRTITRTHARVRPGL